MRSKSVGNVLCAGAPRWTWDPLGPCRAAPRPFSFRFRISWQHIWVNNWLTVYRPYRGLWLYLYTYEHVCVCRMTNWAQGGFYTLLKKH